jgi:hypothetical protein
VVRELFRSLGDAIASVVRRDRYYWDPVHLPFE